jgi:tetratricopeptide (TPR) repeat protein
MQAALQFEQQGRIPDAEAAWKAVLKAKPDDFQAYAHLGLLESRQEHYKKAVAFYRKALKLSPNVLAVEVDLGLALFKSGDLRGAIQTFNPLLKAEPSSSPEAIRLVTLIGLAHYGLGEYAAAVPYLKRAVVSDPKEPPLLMALAQSCLSSKQYQCVLDVYREILAINPDSAEADVLAGEAYDELKNDAGALAQFQAAVKADPKLPNVHFGYGYLLWKANRYSDAQEEFRAELANNPDNPLALAYLGDIAIKLNHSDQAMPYLDRATRLLPFLAIAHLDLGIGYESAGHKSDALRELKRAESLTPDDPGVHWNLGRLYQSMGQKAEANAEFEKTKNLQNATQQSLREQMHQVETEPLGIAGGKEPRQGTTGTVP